MAAPVNAHNYINFFGHDCVQLEKSIAVEGPNNAETKPIPNVYCFRDVSNEAREIEAKKYDDNGYLLVEGVEEDIETFTDSTFRELQHPTIPNEEGIIPAPQNVLLIPCGHKFQETGLRNWYQQPSVSFTCFLCKKPLFEEPIANPNRLVQAQQIVQEPLQNDLNHQLEFFQQRILLQAGQVRQFRQEQEIAELFNNAYPNHHVPPQPSFLKSLINKVSAFGNSHFVLSYFGHRHFGLIIETALILALFLISPVRAFVGDIFLITSLISNLFTAVLSESLLEPYYFFITTCPLSWAILLEMIFQVFPLGFYNKLVAVQIAFTFTAIIDQFDYARRFR